VRRGSSVTVAQAATAGPGLSEYDTSIDCGSGSVAGSSRTLANVTADVTCTFVTARRPDAVPPPRPTAPRVRLVAPGVALASRGFAATCRASTPTLRSCRIEVRRSGAGSGARPLATGRASSPAGARRLTVRLRLTRAGRRALERSLGGVEVVLHVTAATGASGTMRAQRRLRLLSRTHRVEPAGTAFEPDSALLTAAGRRFLERVRARVRDVAAIRCTGHTAQVPERTGVDVLSLRRARVACRYLRRLGLNVRYRVIGAGDRHPRGPNDTEAGRARNRYVTLTISHAR
jgi:outer membrane protein OmpA-like peptidoglycan-associated protein